MSEDTLAKILEIAERFSGVENLNEHSAVDQDMRICGLDIDEFARALHDEFGVDAASWPWGRFVNLNEPSAFVAIWLLWRLITWPVRGRLFDPSPYERLELGHIAAVIDRHEWFEP